MNRAKLPSLVTALRLLSAPLLLYTLLNGLETWAICLILFACATDVLDGHLARRLGVTSAFGAHFDAAADFVLVATAVWVFAVRGIYPTWVLLLIGFMFVQFVVTSGLRQPAYDPVGKYFGAFLFAAICLTLAFPDYAVCYAILMSVLGLSAASVASRSVLFFGLRKKPPLLS